MTDPPPNEPPPQRQALTAPEVAAGLERMPTWAGGPEAIVREVDAPSFRTAIDLVVAVADVAEAMDHHPDIDIRWRHVRLSLSTHTAGGVTDTDLLAAARIEALVAGLG